MMERKPCRIPKDLQFGTARRPGKRDDRPYGEAPPPATAAVPSELQNAVFGWAKVDGQTLVLMRPERIDAFVAAIDEQARTVVREGRAAIDRATADERQQSRGLIDEANRKLRRAWWLMWIGATVLLWGLIAMFIAGAMIWSLTEPGR